MQRAILSKIVQPVGYYFSAEFDARIDAGPGGSWETSGKGSYDRHQARHPIECPT